MFEKDLKEQTQREQIYARINDCGEYQVADVYMKRSGRYLGDVWSKKGMTIEKWYQGGYAIRCDDGRKKGHLAMIIADVVEDVRNGGKKIYD